MQHDQKIFNCILSALFDLKSLFKYFKQITTLYVREDMFNADRSYIQTVLITHFEATYTHADIKRGKEGGGGGLTSSRLLEGMDI